jgi:hypothetical protein
METLTLKNGGYFTKVVTYQIFFQWHAFISKSLAVRVIQNELCQNKKMF